MNDENSLPYLREVLDTSQFRRGQANIIIAPCHSGKTTAAGKIITKHARCPERALYLIDTTAGKQALLSRKDTVKYTRRWSQDLSKEWWGDPFDRNGLRVMSYHQFGLEIQHSPLFVFDLDLIICDEMHNLIKYIGIEYANNKRLNYLGTDAEITTCRLALKTLVQAATRTTHTPLIVVMTATVNALSAEFDRQKVPCAYFDYTGKVHCDLTRNRLYYAHFKDVISELTPNTRAIIYTTQIEQMLQFAQLANNGQNEICCLWGLHNDKNKMSKEQLDIRSSILKTNQIPPNIDLLFINAAYETSININNEDFNTMIIHNSSPDVQIQVRGRLRHDIETLYIYDPDHQHVSQYFPPEYYNRPLFSEDTATIATIMDLKNKDGRALKWPSIHKRLAKDGVIVTKQKKNGRQCWILHPPAVSEEVA